MERIIQVLFSLLAEQEDLVIEYQIKKISEKKKGEETMIKSENET